MSCATCETAHIRWMIGPDMPGVLEVERLSFAHPWGEADFRRHLRERNCIGMVAEVNGLVAGYMVYELHPDRLELLALAVHPYYRRWGVGSWLVAKLRGKLSPQRRKAISFEVAETNVGAQLFFRDMGFRAVEVLRRHFDNDEDAYRMEYRLKEVA
jgi:ribosomal-protein-alanine N-acetyltransferase